MNIGPLNYRSSGAPDSLHPSIEFALEMQKGDKTVHTQTGIYTINHFKCVCKTLVN